MSSRGREEKESTNRLGEYSSPQASTKLKPGNLVVYMPEQTAMSNDDVPRGSLGIFLKYREGWQKHLPGMEPVEVLFPVGVFVVYNDELGVINDSSRNRRHRNGKSRGEALGREDQ